MHSHRHFASRPAAQPGGRMRGPCLRSIGTPLSVPASLHPLRGRRNDRGGRQVVRPCYWSSRMKRSRCAIATWFIAPPQRNWPAVAFRTLGSAAACFPSDPVQRPRTLAYCSERRRDDSVSTRRVAVLSPQHALFPYRRGSAGSGGPPVRNRAAAQSCRHHGWY